MENANATLIRMANQIALNLPPSPGADPVAEIADHLDKFWEPRMKKALLEHEGHGGDGLSPLALQAAQRLRQTLTKRGLMVG
jgi:formate dehydrogenase subunit delta